ncbi:MAG: hypothetical protein ACR2PO_06340 [Methyloligellaceae bacterium]
MSTKEAWKIARNDTLAAVALFVGVVVYAVLGRSNMAIFAGAVAGVAVFVAGKIVTGRRTKPEGDAEAGGDC